MTVLVYYRLLVLLTCNYHTPTQLSFRWTQFGNSWLSFERHDYMILKGLQIVKNCVVESFRLHAKNRVCFSLFLLLFLVSMIWCGVMRKETGRVSNLVYTVFIIILSKALWYLWQLSPPKKLVYKISIYENTAQISLKADTIGVYVCLIAMSDL